MFSKLSERMKAALFFALGMGFFLLAGSLVYFFPKSQYENSTTMNKTDDLSSSIDELYQNLSSNNPGSRVSLVKEIDQSEATKKQIEVEDRWVLYVTGSVKNPGVYQLPADARVFQLVDAAGGLTMTADVVAINLAAQLHDGDHLHIPQKGDDNSIRGRNRTSTGDYYGTVVHTDDGQKSAARVRNLRPNAGNSLNKTSIDINSASTAELQMLPGIGPSLSVRIVDYRNKNGRFKQVSDLLYVPGIGAKKLESIEPFIFAR